MVSKMNLPRKWRSIFLLPSLIAMLFQSQVSTIEAGEYPPFWWFQPQSHPPFILNSPPQKKNKILSSNPLDTSRYTMVYKGWLRTAPGEAMNLSRPSAWASPARWLKQCWSSAWKRCRKMWKIIPIDVESMRVGTVRRPQALLCYTMLYPFAVLPLVWPWCMTFWRGLSYTRHPGSELSLVASCLHLGHVASC